MPQFNSHAHGSFCWVDLLCRDLDAAVEWYGGLFGWEHEAQPSHGTEGPPYGMFFKHGLPVAGIGQMSPAMAAQGVPTAWNSYVSVGDAAATEKRVVELGGTVKYSTMKVFDQGWLAYFNDPSGATFAVWQPGAHHGSAIHGEPGTLCWNELASKDISASKEFYGELFGWRFKSDGGQPPYTEILAGDSVTGGMLPIQPEWGPMPPAWSVYFSVADIAVATAAVASSGGRVIVPAKLIDHVGTFSVVQDAQAAAFCLIQLIQPS